MTWQQQLIAKILLLVARMVCDEPVLREEMKHLSNHISVNAPKLEKAS